MTRKKLKAMIEAKHNLIKKIRFEIFELQQQEILLSDETQRFEEKIESHPKRKYERKPNWLDGKLVGRIFWKENFKDESTGEVVTIEREQVVRVDGEWQ